jgi:hypothetical protein
MTGQRDHADEILAAAGIDGLPEIEVGAGPLTIRAIREALDAGVIPGTFVSGGQVVHAEQVSGSVRAASGQEDSPVPVAATCLDAAGLAALLAARTFTYTVRTRKGNDGNEETYRVEVTPPTALLRAAIAPKDWPRLRPLFGIAAAPVLRPDGTLLQEPGYDPATGLYLASKVPLDPVPAEPTIEQVRHARDFLLRTFLWDFPWVSPADRANYVGLQVTPILLRGGFLRSLVPFSVITAAMPGSGKTILTCGLGMLYGQRVLTWTGDDQELRKSITSVLADPVGTIIFDNLAEGTVIRSPVLARLITDPTWADRLLGKNQTALLRNDRLWLATGNSLRLGGDMGTRSVLVRLNPDMPHPEERTGFAIPNLDQWILLPASQRQVLWNLLVLVTDWTRAGAPRKTGIVMRQFTTWAEVVGGFLAHHGIDEFLGNIDDVRGIDDEDASWAAFLGRWHELHPGQRLTAQQLCQSAQTVIGPGPWAGEFPADRNGKPLGAKALGKRLSGHIDRWHGFHVLRSTLDSHTKVRLWWVDRWSA